MPSTAEKTTLKSHVSNAKVLAKQANQITRRPVDFPPRIPISDIVQTVTRRRSPEEDERTFVWFRFLDGEVATRAVSIGHITSPDGEFEVISFVGIKRLLTQFPLEQILERQNRSKDWTDCDGAYIPDIELWNRVCEQHTVPTWLKDAKDFRSFMVAMEQEWKARHPIPNVTIEKDAIPLMEKSHAIATAYYLPIVVGQPSGEENDEVAAEVPVEKKEKKRRIAHHEKKEPKDEEDIEEQEPVVEISSDDEEKAKPSKSKKKKRSKSEKPEKDSSPKRAKPDRVESDEVVEVKEAPAKKEKKKKQNHSKSTSQPNSGAAGSFEKTFTELYNYRHVTQKLRLRAQKEKAKISILSMEEVVEQLRSTERNSKRTRVLLIFLCALEAISLEKNNNQIDVEMKLPGLNNLFVSNDFKTDSTKHLLECVENMVKTSQVILERVKLRLQEEEKFLANVTRVSSQHGILTCIDNVSKVAPLKFDWLLYITYSALGSPTEEELTEFVQEEELYPELSGLYRSLAKIVNKQKQKKA